MQRTLAALAAALLLPLAADAGKIDREQLALGPYALGTPYESLKSLAGFKLDDKRTEPDKGIVAAKIIDRRVLSTPTIQRLIFKNGKLMRISIIFGQAAEWTEPRVKAWLVEQGWGDPGVKEKFSDGTESYAWHFKNALGMILPADGGRTMASIMTNDD